ncbi:hypothetical protein F0562_035221 [Nyssa sinensis]|uniref:Uncharacterized protein n=1 Tax=Nyssa sinensis TaxID=561372 RepID=A0A5J5ABJ1_9ASTE|nr:hypothetical protein F0562_035221 [Nyssa sinensis]
MVLDLDLNNEPPVEEIILMGNSITIGPNLMQAGENGPSHLQARTDFEHIDEEVVICSPRSFAEARDKSRRNHGVIEVFDEESDIRRGHSELTSRLSPSSNHRRRAPPKRTTINDDLCINLEDSEKTKSRNATESPEMPPKAPTFSCPVCMGPFVEETSTNLCPMMPNFVVGVYP